jgi:hypothetical protein
VECFFQIKKDTYLSLILPSRKPPPKRPQGTGSKHDAFTHAKDLLFSTAPFDIQCLPTTSVLPSWQPQKRITFTTNDYCSAIMAATGPRYVHNNNVGCRRGSFRATIRLQRPVMLSSWRPLSHHVDSPQLFRRITFVDEARNRCLVCIESTERVSVGGGMRAEEDMYRRSGCEISSHFCFF